MNQYLSIIAGTIITEIRFGCSSDEEMRLDNLRREIRRKIGMTNISVIHDPTFCAETGEHYYED